jgi:hypothetical protein
MDEARKLVELDAVMRVLDEMAAERRHTFNEITCQKAAKAIAALPTIDRTAQPVAQNTGHGHVRPRPDGVKMRCGGPGICPECSRERFAPPVASEDALELADWLYGYPPLLMAPEHVKDRVSKIIAILRAARGAK